MEGYVETLLKDYQKRYDNSSKFAHYLDAVYTPKKLTEKILDAYAGSYVELLAELKKQQVTISAKDKMELMELFEEGQKEYNYLSEQIQHNENALDKLIYDIYNLTDEEIAIIEEAQ